MLYSLKTWSVGLGIGALAGGLSHAVGLIGGYYGEIIGASLSGKTFLGISISKVISISFLSEVGAMLGLALGGYLGVSFINYLGNDSGLQNQSIPLWLSTILKKIFWK